MPNALYIVISLITGVFFLILAARQRTWLRCATRATRPQRFVHRAAGTACLLLSFAWLVFAMWIAFEGEDGSPASPTTPISRKGPAA